MTEEQPIPETPPKCEGCSDTGEVFLSEDDTGPCPDCAEPETRAGGSEFTVSPPLQDAEYLTHQESEAMTRVLGWYGSMRGSHRQFFVDVDDLRIAGGEARAEAAERLNGELVTFMRRLTEPTHPDGPPTMDEVRARIEAAGKEPK